MIPWLVRIADSTSTFQLLYFCQQQNTTSGGVHNTRVLFSTPKDVKSCHANLVHDIHVVLGHQFYDWFFPTFFSIASPSGTHRIDVAGKNDVVCANYRDDPLDFSKVQQLHIHVSFEVYINQAYTEVPDSQNWWSYIKTVKSLIWGKA